MKLETNTTNVPNYLPKKEKSFQLDVIAHLIVTKEIGISTTIATLSKKDGRSTKTNLAPMDYHMSCLIIEM